MHTFTVHPASEAPRPPPSSQWADLKAALATLAADEAIFVPLVGDETIGGLRIGAGHAISGQGFETRPTPDASGIWIVRKRPLDAPASGRRAENAAAP